MNDLYFYNDEEDEKGGVANPEYPECDPDTCGGTLISHPEDPSNSPDN